MPAQTDEEAGAGVRSTVAREHISQKRSLAKQTVEKIIAYGVGVLVIVTFFIAYKAGAFGDKEQP